MASVFDRVDFALNKLENQLESNDVEVERRTREEILGPVKSHKKTFEEQIRFVRLFVGSVHKWSDADKAVPDLGFLVDKIKSAMEEIASQLESMSQSHESKKASVLQSFLLPNVTRTTSLSLLEKWALQVMDVFDHSNNIIELLKRDIKRVYESHESLPTHLPLQCFDSPMRYFDGWKKFFLSLEQNLNDLLGIAYFCKQPMWGECRAFALKLPAITEILDLVAENFPQNPNVEELMIHFASVAARAALVACEYWASPTDSNMQNVIVNIANLGWEIDFTTPGYLDMNLRVLKAVQPVTADDVEIFVGKLLVKTPSEAVRRELISLITSVVNIPRQCKDTEDEVRFLTDVKELIMVVGSLQDLLLAGHERIELDLLTNIWHVKIEIFLWIQLTSGYIFQFSPEDQMYALCTGMEYLAFEEPQRYLIEFFSDPPECMENVKKILKFMEEVATEIASLNYSSFAEETTGKLVRNMQFKLIAKIVLFKVESFFMEISYINESLRPTLQGQINSLDEDLKFLLLFVNNQPEIFVQDGELIFTHFQMMARGLISLCHTSRANRITQELVMCMEVLPCDLLEHKITEHLVKNMSLLLSAVLDENNTIMIKLKQKYFHIPSAKFPKTDALGVLDSFLRRFRGLLNNQSDLFASMKDHIQELLADLQFLGSFLRDMLTKDIEVQELKDLVSQVLQITFEAEYFTDSVVLENVAEWHHYLWLYYLLKETRLVKVHVIRTEGMKTSDAGVSDVPQTSRHMVSNAIIPKIGDVVVPLDDEEEEIINLLIGGFLQRDIVSIVGMPGIGKTTLARKVYDNPTIVSHFHIRAWSCVSQIYKKRELLLEILSHITALTGNVLGMTDEDLEFKLYQLLKQKRYLIVMDDMWNTEAWDDLEKSFPNDGNRSRILITSRLQDVFNGKGHTHAHALRPLSEDESWDLLQKKIFHDKGCPNKLVQVGKQISKNCKGLPLSIVAMAGILERIDRRQEVWEQISESLSSRILDDQETRCMGILELSYKHLPENLKACFLYFGAFLEDEDILVQKLVRIWIAEGLVEEIECRNLEDLAEDYLMDLIGRSLVIVSQWRSKGGVKACRVHDMLRNLCVSKAQDENFLRLIIGKDEDCAYFDGLDYGVDSDDSYSSNPITYEDHRLCIHSKRKHFVISRPSGPRVRSLLFFASSDLYPRCPYSISFIFDNFKLLKVLDLECINMGTSFPEGIEKLVHLRYLSVCGDIDSVPSPISSLWNLETLAVKGLKGKVKLPATIWFMAKLRHLHVNNSAVFILESSMLGNSCQLDYLVSLSSPILYYGEGSKAILRRLPNLRKLRCILLEYHEYSGNDDQFPIFDALVQLEALKISYHGRALYSGEFSFPVNLKKLTLSSFRLPWDHISAIGRLPNLEVLKLLSRAFEGEIWKMIDGEFSNLKFLKLDSLNIAKWNAFSDHLPKLQKLVLRSCKHIEEVPSSFGEIPTLEMIEVQWCGESAEESVRKIREEAVEGLKVFILSDSDFRLRT